MTTPLATTDSAEVEPTTDNTFKSLLRNRDYARLWAGQLVSNIGTAISSLALLFYAYSLTQSALAMAILAMAQTAPVVIFAGFVGVYVDRWNRKTIMVASDIVRSILILFIPLAVYFPGNVPPIYWVYTLTFLYAVANAWFFPARNASIPNLVGADELVAANSLSQMTFQVVQLTIPPLGGVLVALLAPDYFIAFAITASTFVFSAVSLRSIRTSLVPKGKISKESVSTQVIQGGRYVAGNSILQFFFIFAILLAGSSGILNALMMPHLEGYIGITEIQFGIILSAGAAVGTLTAYVLGTRKKIPYPLYLVSFAGLVAGIAVFGFAFSTEFWGVLLSWALIGSVDVMLNIPLATLMQDLVVDNYRGRVFALLNVVFTAVQVLGMAVGGVWAEAVVSTIAPLIGAAIGLLAVSVLGVLAVSKWDLHGKLDIMLNDSEKHVARDTESSEVLLETPV